MLKALVVVALVALILVGALMPLKYTSRMKLRVKPPGEGHSRRDEPRTGGGESQGPG
jgi:uncharacterized protein involved in exopolysaccharide biosynthesis